MAAFELVEQPLPHWSWSSYAVRAIFTMRDGGVSDPPYDDLNVALHVGDDDVAVHENRLRVLSSVGLADVRCANQVHGTDVVVDPPDQWSGDFPAADADALASMQADVGLAVMVADCAPVVIAAPAGVAVVHAGWRGLVAGVLERALDSLAVRTAADGGRAAIGPCIGPCCFDVGPEVAARFEAVHVVQSPGVRPRVDLRGAAHARLRRRGVEVDVLEICTVCDQRLFSHRRDGGVTGRQCALAWRAG